MKNKGLNVKEGKTYLEANNGKTSFLHPAFGPETYANIAAQIKEAGLSLPTMEQTASLVYDAWQNQEEVYSKEIIEKLKTNWLWAYNGLLYVPNEGVFIQENPEIKDGKIVMDKNELEKKLESKDKNVKFVPFGFKTGEQSSFELYKNPFVQALAGEEGAEKLESISDKYKLKPSVWSFENVEKPITRVATLDSGRFLGDDWLYVGGYYWSGSDDGYAFGVLNKSRSDAPEKQ